MTVSFRCYYPNGHYNQHYQEIHLRDIHLWALAYKFTHPDCHSMTIQLKWEKGGDADVSADGGRPTDTKKENDVFSGMGSLW